MLFHRSLRRSMSPPATLSRRWLTRPLTLNSSNRRQGTPTFIDRRRFQSSLFTSSKTPKSLFQPTVKKRSPLPDLKHPKLRSDSPSRQY
ncbi:Uncharacterized protein TCM_032481 [Theobroma cacao]|uniref:Uncharacterized protein n=1 Tax=Theobroma cacao TaxID=3641 RepID=A0A061F9W5_THECC|nr:Uncharacterized protein TCM_032481 [Theobroma cacao]